MKVTLDKFGRIVIPKPIRDAIAVEAGSDLLLEVQDEPSGERSILMRPDEHRPLLVREENLLVYKGKSRPGISTW